MDHAMAPRRARPDQVLSVVDARDVTLTLTADEAGIVRPVTVEDVRLADLFGLPVIPDTDAPVQPRRGPKTTTEQAGPAGMEG